MAGPTVTVRRQWSLTQEDALRQLALQLNKVVDDLETLRAEMVAETTSTLPASALVAGKVVTAEAGE